MNRTLALSAIVMFAVILGVSAISPAMADSKASDSSANCDPAGNENAKNDKSQGKSASTPSRASCSTEVPTAG